MCKKNQDKEKIPFMISEDDSESHVEEALYIGRQLSLLTSID